MADFRCKNCYKKFKYDISKGLTWNIPRCPHCDSEWCDYIKYEEKTLGEQDQIDKKSEAERR